MFCLRNQDITDAKAFFYLFFMSNSGYLSNLWKSCWYKAAGCCSLIRASVLRGIDFAPKWLSFSCWHSRLDWISLRLCLQESWDIKMAINWSHLEAALNFCPTWCTLASCSKSCRTTGLISWWNTVFWCDKTWILVVKVFVCTHILTIWTQVFYLNQTMGQQWGNPP